MPLNYDPFRMSKYQDTRPDPFPTFRSNNSGYPMNDSQYNCPRFGGWFRISLRRLVVRVIRLLPLLLLVACKSDRANSADRQPPPPLPALTAFFPDEGSNVRIISLSSMMLGTNLLSRIEDNARVFVERSPAQTAYKLYLLNAAYELWRAAPLRSNVCVLTNGVVSGESAIARTPWQIDLRRYQFCVDTNCFLFSTATIGFSRACNCPNEKTLEAGASDWPKLYYTPDIQQNVQMWRFGFPRRRHG